jgi:predicted ATPase
LIPTYLSVLASAYAEVGHFEDAWRCIADALTAIEATKERWFEAEVHRVAGDIALMSRRLHAAKAEAHFERAIAIAREQKAKSWELRVAVSMARLWRDQDKRTEARDLLVPIYAWFSEGFDTPDLKEAKGLVDELA